jgi:hypothetical protein
VTVDKISKGTGITIGALIPLIGGITWLADTNNQTRANGANIKEMKVHIHDLKRDIRDELKELNKGVSHIKGHLGIEE